MLQRPHYIILSFPDRRVSHRFQILLNVPGETFRASLSQGFHVLCSTFNFVFFNIIYKEMSVTPFSVMADDWHSLDITKYVWIVDGIKIEVFAIFDLRYTYVYVCK